MIIPKYLEKGDTIAVTAPSSGIGDELKIKRFYNGAQMLKERGYSVIFTDNVFKCDERGCSGTGKERANEFNALISDSNVNAIISAAGGDYLMEMLEHIDYEKIKANPKWFQGYSDNTGLVYSIATKCDIATVYGNNFGDFGMKPWQQSVLNSIGTLEGQKVQKSYEYFEDGRYDYETGFEGYHNDKPVKWINGRGEEKIQISGRLLGGCLDVIVFLLGTPYDGTAQFIDKYAKDGIIWNLETFNMEDVTIITHLWQMKQMGYFKGAKGFVFGRPLMYNSWSDTDYKEAVMSILGDLNVPIIFDADLGHKGPQLSFIEGANAVVTSENGKGSLSYI